MDSSRPCHAQNSAPSETRINTYTIPEITGPRAGGQGGSMKAGKVKGLIYENVPLIDVHTAVVYYLGALVRQCGAYYRGDWSSSHYWLVRRGVNGAGGPAQHDGARRRSREDLPEQSIPPNPSHPRLFDHRRVQNGYALIRRPTKFASLCCRCTRTF